MFQPAYRVALGSLVFDSRADPGQSTLTELTVTLDLDTPTDAVAIDLASVGDQVPAVDDTVVVGLGYVDDEVADVFTGTVTGVHPGIVTTRIVAYSGMRKLLQLRVDEMYLQKTAGAIVQDLCDRAGLSTASVEEGIRYPAYVVDGRRHAYRHVRDLADNSGVDVWVAADGRLVFRRFGGSTTFHAFDYAVHVIDASVETTRSSAGGVEVYGESPTDAEGDAAHGWLTKSFSPGRAGADPMVVIEDASLRTNAAAQSAADAASLLRTRRTRTGQLRGLGRATVALGDGVRIAGAPQEQLNGTFQVRSVRHRLTASSGFTTDVGFISLGSDT